ILLPVVESPCLRLEPSVDLVLRTEALIDVASFVNEIEHHAVFNAFAEFVSVDIAAKRLQTGARVSLEQGGAGKADEYRIGHQRLHHSMQTAVLRPVALVHEDEDFTDRLAGSRLQLLNEL